MKMSSRTHHSHPRIRRGKRNGKSKRPLIKNKILVTWAEQKFKIETEFPKK